VSVAPCRADVKCGKQVFPKYPPNAHNARGEFGVVVAAFLSGRQLFLWTLLALALAAGATARLLATVPHAEIGIDDANIFLTYGRNVAAGHGFVFFPGGPRVEGFTSLLWTLAVAAACAVAPEHPERLLLAVNVGLLASTALLLLLWLRHELTCVLGAGYSSRLGNACAPAALLWLFASPAYVCWTTITLMDTGLWSFIATGVTLAAVWTAQASARDSRLAVVVFGALLAMAALTRPESLVLGPVSLALCGGLLLARGARTDMWARLVLPAALFAFSLAAVTGFRLAYFGYPLPNTFYAKVSPRLAHNLKEGVSYVADFLVSTPAAALSVGSAIGVLIVVARRRERSGTGEARPRPLGGALASVSLAVLVLLLLPMVTGGDHFAGHRFCQPAWPLMALPPLGLAIDFWSRRNRTALPPPAWHGTVAALFGVLVLGALGILVRSSLSPRTPVTDPMGIASLDVEFAIAAEGRAIGKVLNEQFSGPEKPVVGATAVGGLAYGYEGQIFDLLGLTDVRMAHSPGLRLGMKDHAAFDEGIFFDASPDLVEPALRRDYRPGKPAKVDPWTDRVLNGLLETERFRTAYTVVVLGVNRDGPASSGVVQVWARRDLVERWRNRGWTLDEILIPPRRR
jgi:arabinofuranosyltransferase